MSPSKTCDHKWPNTQEPGRDHVCKLPNPHPNDSHECLDGERTG